MDCKGFAMIAACYLTILVIMNTRASSTGKQLKLELVQVLFRHGERTLIPLEFAFMEPQNKSLLEPYDFGQLTDKGKRQEYRLGQFLRERYDKFLGDRYRPENVYAYSSDRDRTKESLQTALAALYPPNKKRWNENLNWSPIAIHSLPYNLDILINPDRCPEYEKALMELQYSKDYSNLLVKHTHIMDTLSTYYNRSLSLEDLFYIYNVVNFERSFNLPLPSWYSNEAQQELAECTKSYMLSLSFTKDMVKKNGGTFLRRFLENVDRKRRAEDKRKIYLYAAHEFNLYAVARTHRFDIPFDGLVHHGSAIILETYRDKLNEPTMQVLFWSGVSEKLYAIKLKTCSTTLCPFKNYLQLVKDVIPSEEDMRCLLRPLTLEKLEEYLISEEAFNT